MPSGVEVTVPRPEVLTVSVCSTGGRASKVAETAASLETVTEQVMPPQAPDHPSNFMPVPGAAVKRTLVPLSKLATQSPGQSTPGGDDVTRPVPLMVTLNLRDGMGAGGCAASCAKVAVSERSEVTATSQAAAAQAVLQAAKCQPEPAIASRWTVPAATCSTQWLAQVWACVATAPEPVTSKVSANVLAPASATPVLPDPPSVPPDPEDELPPQATALAATTQSHRIRKSPLLGQSAYAPSTWHAAAGALGRAGERAPRLSTSWSAGCYSCDWSRLTNSSALWTCALKRISDEKRSRITPALSITNVTRPGSKPSVFVTPIFSRSTPPGSDASTNGSL